MLGEHPYSGEEEEEEEEEEEGKGGQAGRRRGYYTWYQLKMRIQASDKELKVALAEMGALQIKGTVAENRTTTTGKRNQ